MPPKRKRKLDSIPYDPIGVALLHRLLANFVNAYDRRREMRTPVILETIPEDWKDERTFYRAIITLFDQKEAATEDALLAVMQAWGVKDAESILDEIMAHRSKSANPPVNLPALLFNEWLQRIQLVQASEENMTLARTSTEKSLAEVAEQMQQNIAIAAPSIEIITSKTPLEQFQDWRIMQQEKADRKLHGSEVTAIYPFKDLDQLLPAGLRVGDPCLITAKSGTGKTTLGNVLAEFWAWTLGFYVIYVSQETDDALLNQRRMARHLGIPTKCFDADTTVGNHLVPMYDPLLEPWTTIDTYWLNFLEEKEAKGRVVTVSGTGSRITTVIDKMAPHLDIAAKLGMEVIVIWDYLQKFAWRHYGFRGDQSERLGLAANAHAIKNYTQREKIRSVLFSQESEDTDKEGNQTAIRARGSQEANIVSQVAISVVRPKAKGDERVQWPRGNNGISGKPVQLLNAIGEPRFLAQQGDYSGLNALLRIYKSNDGRPSGDALIYFEGALHNVKCAHTPVKEYKQLFPLTQQAF